MINRVILVGRLTRDPELKYTTGGIANLRFSLAVNRNFKDDKGNQQADFINCMAWRGQAENMAKFLKKGALIGLEGRIETGSYDERGKVRINNKCHHVLNNLKKQDIIHSHLQVKVLHLILNRKISIPMILISQIRMLLQIIIIRSIQQLFEQAK